MMYQVIFPGRGSKGSACLENAGLGSMSGLPGERWCDVPKGPNGIGFCRMVTWQDPDAPEVPVTCPQSWQYTEYDNFLIGVNPDDMPAHADMILPEEDVTPGHPVEFANMDLIVPVAEKLEASHRLVGGQWVRKVSSRYEAFYEQAEEIWEQVAVALDASGLMDMDEDKRPKRAPISLDIANNFVCDALRINYKIFPEVVDCIGLLDDLSVARVVVAVLDIGDIAAVKEDKKKDHSVDIPVT